MASMIVARCPLCQARRTGEPGTENRERRMNGKIHFSFSVSCFLFTSSGPLVEGASAAEEVAGKSAGRGMAPMRQRGGIDQFRRPPAGGAPGVFEQGFEGRAVGGGDLPHRPGVLVREVEPHR